MDSRRLKADPNFKPHLQTEGDEHFANGIFDFNVSRMLAHIETNPALFPIEKVELKALYEYAGDHLDEATVRSADLGRPIVLAEISPGRFNLIDGNHRVERGRREGVLTLPGYRLRADQHLTFLTSMKAYQSFIQYWNSKLDG
jgi:hypothetical protein